MTDVHNTGKGYAFVTFDNKESADAVSINIIVKYFVNYSSSSGHS